MPLPSPEQLQQLGQVDPEMQVIIQSPAFKSTSQIDYTDPTAGLVALRTLLKKLGAAPADSRVVESEQAYTTRDGTVLRLVVYTPATATGTQKLPLLVWYHGGGCCTGTPDGDPRFCREVALSQNCVIVCPEYRLAPEFKFPTGIYDCQDALQHIASNASTFEADPSLGFVVGGESWGSVVAAIMTLMAREKNLSPALTGTYLSCGSYTPPLAVPEEYKNHYLSRFDPICLAAPGLNEASKRAFDWALQPDYTSPIYRAILWPTGHASLPRAYFQTCGMDINRDDSYVYQNVLEKNGVETRLDVYPGSPHCFWWTFPGVQMTQKWREDTQKGFSWLFGKSI